MSLSDKERRQLQAKRIKKLKYKATGLYLYHPATDSWIPAQCDDEGRLVIDPSDLDTRYLKLDGTNKMLADFDLDTYRLLLQHVLLRSLPSDYLVVRNRANTDYGRIKGGAFSCYGDITLSAGKSIILPAGIGGMVIGAGCAFNTPTISIYDAIVSNPGGAFYGDYYVAQQILSLPGSPETGTIVFHDGHFKGWNGTAWVQLD